MFIDTYIVNDLDSLLLEFHLSRQSLLAPRLWYSNPVYDLLNITYIQNKKKNIEDYSDKPKKSIQEYVLSIGILDKDLHCNQYYFISNNIYQSSSFLTKFTSTDLTKEATTYVMHILHNHIYNERENNFNKLEPLQKLINENLEKNHKLMF